MAATYSQLGIIAGHPDFQGRVNVGMSNCASTIYGESATTPGHANRAAFSTKVLNGNFSLTAAVWGVLSNNNIQAEADPTLPGDGIKDTDILSAIYAVWDCMAGA